MPTVAWRMAQQQPDVQARAAGPRCLKLPMAGRHMDLGLTGKVAIVAAGSKGLGKACALALAREGARVAICSRTEADLAAAEADIRGETGAGVLTQAGAGARGTGLT